MHDEKAPDGAMLSSFDADCAMDCTSRKQVMQGRLALAVKRLRAALDRHLTEFDDGEIAKARNNLRMVTVDLQEFDYWKNNAAELRNIVALLWEADRFVGTSDLRLSAQRNN